MTCGIELPAAHLQVAKLIAQEKSSREIARELWYEMQTVYNYSNRIYDALGLTGLPDVEKRRRVKKFIEEHYLDLERIERPLPPEPYFAHPHSPHKNFTGRIRERQMLTNWLTEADRPVLVLIGMGGMGKSDLAWIWLQRDMLGRSPSGLPQGASEVAKACRVPKTARPEGVMWWSFTDPEAHFDAFLDKALIYFSSGKVNPREIPSSYEKTQELVQQLQRRRYLLVLDTFEQELRGYANPSASYRGDAVLKDAEIDPRECSNPNAANFLRYVAALSPREGESQVLLISRYRPLISRPRPHELVELAGCQEVKLDNLDREDAITFFLAQGIKGTRAEIEMVCAPYDYHPQTLSLLAGAIVHDKQYPGDIRAADHYPALSELEDKGHLSFLQEVYESLDPQKRELLSRISAFRGSMSYEPLSRFNTYRSDRQFKAALDELIDRRLLDFSPERRRFDIHSLVREYAYLRLTNKTDVHRRLMKYFKKTVPVPEEVRSLEDLAPVVERYHHTANAGKYEDAQELYRHELGDIYFRFGAYHTQIELLRALFPDGEDHPPRLKDKRAQAWTVNALASAYRHTGQPRLAVRLLKATGALDEGHDPRDLATNLEHLATLHVSLGELADAGQNILQARALRCEVLTQSDMEEDVRRRAIQRQAINHRALGMLLARRGHFDEAGQELDTALNSFRDYGFEVSEGIALAHLAWCVHLMGNTGDAFEHATQAREIAIRHQGERDRMRAEWLLGAARLVMAAEEKDRQNEFLAEAQTYLAEALIRCQRTNAIDYEPDILLSWARWYRTKGNIQEAWKHAQEALAIADRCEYRLEQADIHNFLAQLALDAGDRATAAEHANVAYERAWCDGPPYCYKFALKEAEGLLRKFGGTTPQVNGMQST